MEALTGRPFQKEAAQSVPLLFFIGADDTNDSLTFRDGYEAEDEELAFRLFGGTPAQRWPVAERMYKDAGFRATFKAYSGVGHRLTDEMGRDCVSFFARHLHRD